MKMFFRVETRGGWVRVGAGGWGVKNELPTEFCRLSALSGPPAAALVIWQSHWWECDFTSCASDPPIVHVQTVVGTSSTCAVGKVLYLVQEFFPLPPSGRRICISQPTDLDIITSEREITLGEQLAPLAICCTSARFHGGLWARDSVHSLFSPGNRHLYLSIQGI